MALHFFFGDFFGGEFFGSGPVAYVDTHDGDDRKRFDAKLREAKERLRQQITDAVDPQAAAERMRLALRAVAPTLQPPGFDFDADDEEIILLL